MGECNSSSWFVSLDCALVVDHELGEPLMQEDAQEQRGKERERKGREGGTKGRDTCPMEGEGHATQS